jgi:hypothetical protein
MGRATSKGGGVLADQRREGWQKADESRKWRMQPHDMVHSSSSSSKTKNVEGDRLAVAAALDIGRAALADMVEMEPESRNDEGSMSDATDVDSMIVSSNVFAQNQMQNIIKQRVQALTAQRDGSEPALREDSIDKLEARLSRDWEADRSLVSIDISDIGQVLGALGEPVREDTEEETREEPEAELLDHHEPLPAVSEEQENDTVDIDSKKKKKSSGQKLKFRSGAAAFKKKLAESKAKKQKKSDLKAAKAKVTEMPKTNDSPPPPKEHDAVEEHDELLKLQNYIQPDPAAKEGEEPTTENPLVNDDAEEPNDDAEATVDEVPNHEESFAEKVAKVPVEESVAPKKHSKKKKKHPFKSSRQRHPKKSAARHSWWNRNEAMASPHVDSNEVDLLPTVPIVAPQVILSSVAVPQEVAEMEKKQGGGESKVGKWSLKLKLLPRHLMQRSNRNTETLEALEAPEDSVMNESMLWDVAPGENQNSAVSDQPAKFLQEEEPEVLSVIPEEVKTISWIRKLISALEKEEAQIEVDESSATDVLAETAWKRRMSIVLAQEDKRIEEDALNGTTGKQDDGQTSWMKKMVTALETEEKRLGENETDRTQKVREMVKSLEEIKEDCDDDMTRVTWVRNMMTALKKEESQIDNVTLRGVRLKRTWVKKMVEALEDGEERISLEAAEGTSKQDQDTSSKLVLEIMLAMQDEDRRIGPEAAKRHWEWVKTVVDRLDEEPPIECTTIDSAERNEKDPILELVTAMSQEEPTEDSKISQPITIVESASIPEEGHTCCWIPISMRLPTVSGKSEKHVITSTKEEAHRVLQIMPSHDPVMQDDSTTISFHSSFVKPATFRSQRKLIRSPSLTRGHSRIPAKKMPAIPLVWRPSDISGVSTQDGVQELEDALMNMENNIAQWVSDNCAQYCQGVCISVNTLQHNFNQMFTTQGKTDRVNDDEEGNMQTWETNESSFDGSVLSNPNERQWQCDTVVEEEADDIVFPDPMLARSISEGSKGAKMESELARSISEGSRGAVKESEPAEESKLTEAAEPAKEDETVFESSPEKVVASSPCDDGASVPMECNPLEVRKEDDEIKCRQIIKLTQRGLRCFCNPDS